MKAFRYNNVKLYFRLSKQVAWWHQIRLKIPSSKRSLLPALTGKYEAKPGLASLTWPCLGQAKDRKQSLGFSLHLDLHLSLSL